jgi:hypothetical protein
LFSSLLVGPNVHNLAPMFARRRLFHQVWLGDTAQARQAAVNLAARAA